MNEVHEAIREMVAWERGVPHRIQHFLKVHSFCRYIGMEEGLDEATLRRLELAAVVHDIGIHAAEAKYGNSNGKYQEELGLAPARDLLTAQGFSPEDIERVCYLVGHHHTYKNIDGIDYQILVEADFLVNFFEDNISKTGIEHALTHVFKTETGKRLCREMFLEEYRIVRP